MTSHDRDFDRLARAWLELGPDVAPDRPIAAVLQAIETTAQVRRPWRWPIRRSPTMSRIMILAVLAGTIALLIGGLVLSGGGSRQSDSPIVPPSPSAGPTSSEPGPVPDAVKGGWSAASRGTSMESSPVTTLMLGGSSVDDTAPLFSLDYPGMPSRMLGSNVVEEAPGTLLFVLSATGSSGCAFQAEGRYRWSVSEDGQWLTLEQVSEACPVRGEILPGTWQRNLGFSSHGGPGILTNFEPYMTLTLPADTWNGAEFAMTDTVSTESQKRGLKVWKDLDGFFDPCDRSKGRLLIDPGMDAFLAYLRTDPRFSVTHDREFQIDGRRAVDIAFRVGQNLSEPCADLDGDPDNPRGVLTWVPQDEPNSSFFWNTELGGAGIAAVTEVDGTTVVFESVNVETGPADADREVLDTVRFVDALPTPPPS